jgi:predicted TIM-barrel fold metal-dependent hydrolase
MSMPARSIGPEDLKGKVTDIHAHVGVSIKSYAALEYPYCQSIEGLYYRQRVNNVDYSVVFTYGTDLYFDLGTLIRSGRMIPAEEPFGEAPYELENRMLFTEIYRFCPEHRDRFLPFVVIDPARRIREQLKALRELAAQHPIYGIKVVPVGCQSKVTGLLEEGEALLDFAEELDLPLLFHVTVHPEEEYSQVSDTFRVIERHPELRFCLAHCVSLSRQYLERAAVTPNVWVDTSALKIQVQAAYENYAFMAPPAERYDWDYSDHRQVMKELMNRFPDTIIWGSDSPTYSYIARRLQGAGSYIDFNLKGTYEQEKEALDALAPDLREKACSTNSIAFLFG